MSTQLITDIFIQKLKLCKNCDIYFIKAAEENRSLTVKGFTDLLCMKCFSKKSAKSVVNSGNKEQFEFTADLGESGRFLKKSAKSVVKADI